MFQVFLLFNVYFEKISISNFTFVMDLKWIALFVLSIPKTFYILFNGFSVLYRKSFIIYVD